MDFTSVTVPDDMRYFPGAVCGPAENLDVFVVDRGDFSVDAQIVPK